MRKLLPIVLAVPAFAFVVRAIAHAVHAPFGRDQGIFHYIAWALASGQRDYVDLHDVQGPLIHAIHFFALKALGPSELRFRVFDFVLSSAVYFGAGAAIARRDRAMWGAVAWVALSAQYLLYGYWDEAQRESFYALFTLASIAFQLAEPRTAFFALAGALSAIPWFGKPTAVFASIAQIAALLLDDELPRKKRLLSAWGAGAVGGVLVMLAFVIGTGSVAGFIDSLRLAATVYRPIWHKPFFELWNAWGNAPWLEMGAATLAGVLFLIWKKYVPRRFLVIAFWMFSGFLAYFAQGKGFSYHMHPITAGTHLAWIACLTIERPPKIALPSAALVALYLALEAWRSPHQSAPMIAGGPDFFPGELERAAAFVRASTREDDRVQMYAHDPYLLFQARRLSATPFLLSMELDVDASIEGAPEQADSLRAFAQKNEDALVSAMEAAPPAAFVLVDLQPFTHPPDADADFEAHCPKAFAFMKAHASPAMRFGHVRVWLRNDRAPADVY